MRADGRLPVRQADGPFAEAGRIGLEIVGPADRIVDLRPVVLGEGEQPGRRLEFLGELRELERTWLKLLKAAGRAVNPRDDPRGLARVAQQLQQLVPRHDPKLAQVSVLRHGIAHQDHMLRQNDVDLCGDSSAGETLLAAWSLPGRSAGLPYR